MTGKIRTLRVDKGFGFIKDDAGNEYFFHQSAVYGEGLEDLREGDSVAAGATLFRVESPEDTAALAEAEARVAQQAAELADLQKGKRPDELAVTAAQLAQARSALEKVFVAGGVR